MQQQLFISTMNCTQLVNAYSADGCPEKTNQTGMNDHRSQEWQDQTSFVKQKKILCRSVKRKCDVIANRRANATETHEDLTGVSPSHLRPNDECLFVTHASNVDDTVQNRTNEAGGIVTSRQNRSFSQPLMASIRRLRILEFEIQAVPSFNGCPRWAKQLMYSYFQDLAIALRGAIYSTMIVQRQCQSFANSKERQRQRFDALDFEEFSAGEPQPWLNDDLGDTDDELRLYDGSQAAIIRHVFVPSTQRRTECYINASLCQLTGIPMKDYLEMVTRACLPVHMSPLDFLCMLIEDLRTCLNVRSLDVVLWGWPGRPVALIERRTERRFDRRGQHWCNVIFHRVITPEHFAANYCASPPPAAAPHPPGSNRDAMPPAAGQAAAVPGRAAKLPCLWRAIVGLQGGEELLATAEAGRDVSMEQLVGMPAGQAAMAALAEEVLRRFDHVARAARQILEGSPEIEAWARERVEDGRVAREQWP